MNVETKYQNMHCLNPIPRSFHLLDLMNLDHVRNYSYEIIAELIIPIMLFLLQVHPGWF